MATIENQFVNFKIITRNGTGRFYRRSAFGIFAFLMSFVLIFGEEVPGPVVATIVFSVVLLLIFLRIKLQLLRERDEIGWIMLNSEQIVIKLGNDETTYAINNNTTLSIEIRGYEGEPIIGQWFANKKGYDNYLSLKNGNETKRYEILISNKMKIFILDRLITYYRQQGVFINYVNKSFEDSKKSILLQLLLIFRHER